MKPPGEHVSQVGAIAEQPAVDRQNRAQRLLPPQPGRQALGKKQRRDDTPGRAVRRQYPEHGPPAEVHEQLAADERAEYRRHAHHQDQHRQHPDRLAFVEQVADDGPGNDERGAAAKCLKEAEADQRLDVPCERTADRRRDEQEQAEGQGRLAPEAIGEWSVEQLADGNADEIRRQAHLNRRGAGPQVACNRRQRRQVHVDGERPHGRQRAEDDGSIVGSAMRHPQAYVNRRDAEHAEKPTLRLCALCGDV